MPDETLSVLDIAQRLTKIETLLETFNRTMDSFAKSHSDEIVALKARVESLEKFRWAIVGAAAAGGGLAGAGLDKLFG